MSMLSVAWLAFLSLFLVVSLFVSTRAVKEVEKQSGKQSNRADRARRASYTARTITTASVFFTVLLLPLWAGLCFLAQKIGVLPLGMLLLENEPPGAWSAEAMPYGVLMPWFYFWSDAEVGVMTVERFFQGLLGGTQSLAFVLTCAVLIPCSLIAAWAIGPVVWQEVRKPDAKAANAPGVAAAQGEWLDRGFWCLRLAGWFMRWGVVGYFLLLVTLMVLKFTPVWDDVAACLRTILDGAPLAAVGAIVLATAGSRLACRGRLDRLALGFRPAVDLAFDVDNHLREHPRGKNPRLRISARYASLLRHLSQWRSDGANPKSYQAIIIVAHSQGSVITADLLRYLHREQRYAATTREDPELAPILGRAIPVDFFTMGCPLRQLYSLRFPHQYRWVRHGSGEGYTDPVPDNQLPQPNHISVRRWVNAYRSGDYVGRYLACRGKCRPKAH